MSGRLLSRNTLLCLLFSGGFLFFVFSNFVNRPTITDPILFVSRQIPCCGSVYMSEANALPGVGGFSKYQVAAPGFLCVLYPDGKTDTLVNGAEPSEASLFLIDVSAPNISWDAKKIVFAGLPQGNYEEGNNNQINREHNAWRIYVINVEGTGLRQVTGLADIPGSDQNLNLDQFSPLARQSLRGYDDTDPIWLPDGRICFSSTRFPTLAMYNATRASNLYVVEEDGTRLHRITSEKNGADRPVVDPVTGKIVYARWWRNFYWPYDGMESVSNTQYPQGWTYHAGLTSDLNSVIDNELYMFNNNAFVLTEINPDGSDLRIFSAYFRETSLNSCYGGSFDEEGNFYGNWFPIEHLTESSGFGGIKKYFRNGLKPPAGIAGITEYGNLDYYQTNPTSYGIFKGEYAAEPFVTDDGNILFSKASTPEQDYGIYVMNPNGSQVELLLDIPGQTELRAQVIKPRKLPPVLYDKHQDIAGLLPPTGLSDLRKEGTFVFDCRNIYYNAPVDDPIISAPKVGDVGSVRFFAAPLLHQQYGSVEALDFPILYNELPVSEFGRVLETDAPANVPLFEQGRAPQSAGYHIPRTGGGIMDGAAQVMGFNFGKPGQKVTCVGCHNGHSRILVPETPEELMFTNLAPGAGIKASSAMNPAGYAIDRKNFTAKGKHWFSAENANPNAQWLSLYWLVPIWTKKIVLHNVPAGFDVNIQKSVIRFYADKEATEEIYSHTLNQSLSETGTAIELPAVLKMQAMKMEFLDCKGGIYHWDCAAIGDIEVIASPVNPDRFHEIKDCNGITYGPHLIDSCGVCLLPDDPAFNNCVVSVTSVKEENLPDVYPNPARHRFTISKPTNMKEVPFDVLDYHGQLVWKGILSGPGETIQTEHWKQGLYVIVFNLDKKRHLKKIIIH